MRDRILHLARQPSARTARRSPTPRVCSPPVRAHLIRSSVSRLQTINAYAAMKTFIDLVGRLDRLRDRPRSVGGQMRSIHLAVTGRRSQYQAASESASPTNIALRKNGLTILPSKGLGPLDRLRKALGGDDGV